MTDEVRTRSATGGEKGVKPIVFSQIPYEALKQKGLVYSYGAGKYNAHNFRKGYEWSKSFDALCRHLFAFWAGEDLDPESGLPHMAHVGWHADVLVTFMKEHPQFDDRYKAPRVPTLREALEWAEQPESDGADEALRSLQHEALMAQIEKNAIGDPLNEIDFKGVLTHDPMPPMPTTPDYTGIDATTTVRYYVEGNEVSEEEWEWWNRQATTQDEEQS